jgi:hypothetical protein
VKIVSIFAATALFTLSGIAQAQDMAALSKVREHCMADVKKYCSKQAGNPDLVLGCLQKNKKKVKPACSKAVALLPAKPPTIPSK